MSAPRGPVHPPDLPHRDHLGGAHCLHAGGGGTLLTTCCWCADRMYAPAECPFVGVAYGRPWPCGLPPGHAGIHETAPEPEEHGPYAPAETL